MCIVSGINRGLASTACIFTCVSCQTLERAITQITAPSHKQPTSDPHSSTPLFWLHYATLQLDPMMRVWRSAVRFSGGSRQLIERLLEHVDAAVQRMSDAVSVQFHYSSPVTKIVSLAAPGDTAGEIAIVFSHKFLTVLKKKKKVYFLCCFINNDLFVAVEYVHTNSNTRNGLFCWKEGIPPLLFSSTTSCLSQWNMYVAIRTQEMGNFTECARYSKEMADLETTVITMIQNPKIWSQSPSTTKLG